MNAPTVFSSIALAMALSTGATAGAAQNLPGDIAAIPRADVSLFDYDRQLPLETESQRIGEESGVQIFRVSYESPAGGRVTGHLYVPEGDGPFAGIVYAHGTGSGSRTQAPRAIYLARHGAVVITPDAPYIRHDAEPISFTPADSIDQVQHIQDLRRAADLLLERHDVDPDRLAFIGRSHGGAMGALVAALEPRFRTHILIVADGGLIAHMTSPFAYTEPFDEQPEAGRERWLRAMWPIEPSRFVDGISRPVLLQNSRTDEAVPWQIAEDLHAAIEGEKEVRWYEGGHRLDARSFYDQLVWLHREIGMRAPAEEARSGPDFTTPARDLDALAAPSSEPSGG